MIGVFDSGVGGLHSFRKLRELLPREDIIYLAHRSGAPYGTKDRDTILRYTRDNIRHLCAMGADDVLIACCTASSTHHLLQGEERRASHPIICAAAEEALRYGERIAVIATEHTVRTRAFSTAIHRINPDAYVAELSTQILVSLVELGARDGELLPREGDLLDKIAGQIRSHTPDSLILGCTHFSALAGELGNRLHEVEIINAATVGACHLSESTASQPRRGRGKVSYTEGDRRGHG